MSTKIRLLITVKTYPNPSSKYLETCCTAGMTENGDFLRLYPIKYRYLPDHKKYKKYQWIELETEKFEKDPRSESFRPISDSIRLLEKVPTSNKWEERKKIVLSKGTQTMCFLNSKKQTEISLGIVKPRLVKNFLYKPVNRKWTPKIQKRFDQLQIFDPQPKQLEKIPYKFSYEFLCEEKDCKGHKMLIADWEVAELYRRMRTKFQDEKIACEKVKSKFFGELCSDKYDTYFYVGTVLKYATWIILGVFWPKH